MTALALLLFGCGQTHYFSPGASTGTVQVSNTKVTPTPPPADLSVSTPMEQPLYSLYYPPSYPKPQMETSCSPNRVYPNPCNGSFHWAPASCNYSCNTATRAVGSQTWSIGSLPICTPVGDLCRAFGQPYLNAQQIAGRLAWTRKCFGGYAEVVGNGDQPGQLQQAASIGAKNGENSTIPCNLYPAFGYIDGHNVKHYVEAPTDGNALCSAVPFGTEPLYYCSSPLAYAASEAPDCGAQGSAVNAAGVHYCVRDGN